MKRTVTLFLVFLFVFVLGTNAFAKVIYTYGDWNIQKIDNQYCISTYTGTDSDVTVPDEYMGQSMTTVLGYAFVGNKSIQSVTFSDGISTLGTNVFLSATSLTDVHFSSAITEIGEETFTDTPSLSSVNLSDTKISEVKKKLFLNSGISDIVLPETCCKIGEKAFGGCIDLERILIPAGVTEIADDAFAGCDDLVINCYTDSYAHQYAVEKNIPFVLIDAPFEVTFIMGDADGDGYITVLDATKVQRVLADLDEDPDGMIALRAADGEVLNIMHATAIQRYLADYDVKEPIGEEVTRIVNA